MGRLLTFVLIIIIPLLKRVCVFNRAEQGVCKCGLYITASILHTMACDCGNGHLTAYGK